MEEGRSPSRTKTGDTAVGLLSQGLSPKHKTGTRSVNWTGSAERVDIDPDNWGGKLNPIISSNRVPHKPLEYYIGTSRPWTEREA